MRLRFWIIRICFLCFFFGLITYLYQVQVSHRSYYAERVEAQQEATESFNRSRGLLFFTDKNKNAIPAVVNKEYPIVYAVPEEVENPEMVANSISSIFGIDANELKKSFLKEGDLYELISEKATNDQVSRVKELNYKGIYIKNEIFRFYPFKDLASHILGYISSGSDGIVTGRYGIELLFNKELSGEQKKENGNDIHLTIDPTVQREGEKIIQELLNEWGAESANIIVQEPFSGKILAMANLPKFNPNEYNKYPISSFLNASVQSVYEPGSVFKIVTMSSGLDSGKITPDTTYNDVGYANLNGRTIKNWDEKSHGIQTMRQVIEKSLNTGTIFAEKKMGHDIFREYVKKFGFGEKTGIVLPGEVAGNIKNLSSKEDVNYATASFGQGISVTPLQMISAVSAIANGGVLMRPLLREDEEQEVVRRVISKESADLMTDILVGAVNVNVLAQIPQYKVAGKTGTAFIPNFSHGGYTDDVINTYVGFAPASHPRFSILIKLVKPKSAPLAGQTVVPAFKKLTEYLLNYYQAAPDSVSK